MHLYEKGVKTIQQVSHDLVDIATMTASTCTIYTVLQPPKISNYFTVIKNTGKKQNSHSYMHTHAKPRTPSPPKYYLLFSPINS